MSSGRFLTLGSGVQMAQPTCAPARSRAWKENQSQNPKRFRSRKWQIQQVVQICRFLLEAFQYLKPSTPPFLAGFSMMLNREPQHHPQTLRLPTAESSGNWHKSSLFFVMISKDMRSTMLAEMIEKPTRSNINTQYSSFRKKRCFFQYLKNRMLSEKSKTTLNNYTLFTLYSVWSLSHTTLPPSSYRSLKSHWVGCHASRHVIPSRIWSRPRVPCHVAIHIHLGYTPLGNRDNLWPSQSRVTTFCRAFPVRLASCQTLVESLTETLSANSKQDPGPQNGVILCKGLVLPWQKSIKQQRPRMRNDA